MKAGDIMNKKGEKSGLGTIVLGVIIALLILMFL